MITIIRNAKVYQPEEAGRKDILLIDGKIGAVAENISLEIKNADGLLSEIDATGMIAVPGFIDSHTHMTGGGGEGGYRTRTPEAVLTDFTMAGITTAVGCLGTDGVTRNMISLLAKAKGLEEEGLSTYIYTGSYHVPPVTVTGEVMKDLLIVDKIIGIGEIAVSDHRSSQPTLSEFQRLAADARVGGMLSGKAGILNIHLGDGSRMLDLILQTVEQTEIPITQFLPTHINRNRELFEEGILYAKKGGYIDFTASNDPVFWEEKYGEVRTCTGIKRLLDENISQDQFTISSDAQGSLPLFNEKMEFVGLGVGKPECILKEIRAAVLEYKIPLEVMLRAVTVNPARILKLTGKGRIEAGFDADLCLLDEAELILDTVFCKGKRMVYDGHPEVYGTFENVK
ncbi:beta-aspartyl-peptidase [Anoxybacterium hadale]|uniref:Beta-aspartyl-peptidase n=1 Tax=Anoxybacterium hadale TaxID=3408580 RepID=A0ACD1A9X6_9FIRM|nr:beta-aspartyl-peptidase [Clostridiales bacterium]